MMIKESPYEVTNILLGEFLYKIPYESLVVSGQEQNLSCVKMVVL